MREVREWARALPRGCDVLDAGCGPGVPITVVLVEEGLNVSGVDGSAALWRRFGRTCRGCRWCVRMSRLQSSLVGDLMLW